MAVVAESASSVFVLPSMNVMGSIRGFLDLVAWEGCACVRVCVLGGDVGKGKTEIVK